MVEKIKYKNKLLAIIVSGNYRKKKGITFFTPNNATQQIGYMKHKKGHKIVPHKHSKRITRIFPTTEVLLLLKGILRVDFYKQNKKYLFSKILKEKCIIFLVHGGHGFKVIKDVEMIEVKQGPYDIAKDKVKFDQISEKKIKIKKN
tara:strand:- start:559 stop:996 length:438 start_codon:yes stop_codon:yes gene_type:complete